MQEDDRRGGHEDTIAEEAPFISEGAPHPKMSSRRRGGPGPITSAAFGAFQGLQSAEPPGQRQQETNASSNAPNASNAEESGLAYPRTNMPRWGLFRWFLNVDLSCLLFLQSVRRRLPLCVRSFFDRMISGHPAHDISLVIWIAAAGCLWAIGWPLAWLVVGNMTLSFILAWVLPMIVAPLKLVAIVGRWGNLLRGLGDALEHIYRTPETYDPRLKPRARVSPTGFPCIELHLLTVLWSCILLSYLSPKAIYYNTGTGGSVEPQSKVVSTALITTCAITFGFFLWIRLYSGTHLLWQLVASCVLGGLSVPLEVTLANNYFPKGVSVTMHSVTMTLVVFLWLGYLCYQAESNAAPFMRLEREEYLRVMREIAASSANPSSDMVHRAFRYEIQQQQESKEQGQQQKDKEKSSAGPPKGKRDDGKAGKKKDEVARADSDEDRADRRKRKGSSRSQSRANSEGEESEVKRRRSSSTADRAADRSDRDRRDRDRDRDRGRDDRGAASGTDGGGGYTSAESRSTYASRSTAGGGGSSSTNFGPAIPLPFVTSNSNNSNSNNAGGSLYRAGITGSAAGGLNMAAGSREKVVMLRPPSGAGAGAGLGRPPSGPSSASASASAPSQQHKGFLATIFSSQPPLPPRASELVYDGDSVLERQPRRDGYSQLMESMRAQKAIDERERIAYLERKKRAEEAARLSSSNGGGDVVGSGSGSDSAGGGGGGNNSRSSSGMGRPPAGPTRRSASPPAGPM